MGREPSSKTAWLPQTGTISTCNMVQSVGPAGAKFTRTADSGSPSSSSPRGQLGARLIQVQLERLDDTGALYAAEIEVAVAGTEPLDLAAIPGSRFHGVLLIECHLRTRGLAREPDRGRVVPGRDALSDQTFGSS